MVDTEYSTPHKEENRLHDKALEKCRVMHPRLLSLLLVDGHFFMDCLTVFFLIIPMV